MARTLLTIGNPKTVKGETAGYLTAVLHLAPSTLSGWNTCPMASDGCARACLNTAGRGGIIKKGETTNPIQKARIARTRMFFENRGAFLRLLADEIHKVIRKAHHNHLRPVFRLNGTSDIRWERIAFSMGGKSFRNIFELFPSTTFYDYTKLSNRRDLPANYSLTFSLSESNQGEAIVAHSMGHNVAIVFDGGLPNSFQLGPYHLPVIDGDLNDLRFLDPSGVVVGLKAKGKARHDLSGFVYGKGETQLRGFTLPMVSNL